MAFSGKQYTALQCYALPGRTFTFGAKRPPFQVIRYFTLEMARSILFMLEITRSTALTTEIERQVGIQSEI